ncbi:MAG: rRNA maturation RNase YbeY [Lachnospira sp.]|nr:rRNA maturation RNase YbeY [Lachnospira sp.]
MDIMIEYDTEVQLGFDYRKVIEDMVMEAVEVYACPYDYEVSVTLTGNERIHEVNRRFRNIDCATDVLSFPMLTFQKAGDFSNIDESEELFNPDTGNLMLGDIMVSVDKVEEQALQYGHSKKRELAFLIAHSMLHLMGFDHIKEEERKDMEKRQELLLQRKGYTRE